MIKTPLKRDLKATAIKFFICDFETARQNHLAKQEEIRIGKRDKSYVHAIFNPEKVSAESLFYIGLLVEGLALIFNVGYQLNLSPRSDSPKYLYELIRDSGFLKEIILPLTLLALLIHQIFIKNSFVEINEIVSEKWENNPKPFYFPNDLIFSWCERMLRFLFFVMLSIIIGEIQYLLLILSEIFPSLRFLNGNGELTKVFIQTCFFTTCIVLAWIILMFIAQVVAKAKHQKMKNEPEFQEWDNSGMKKIMIFFCSSALAFSIWFFILKFIDSKNIEWINTWLFWVSGFYVALIYLRLLDQVLKRFFKEKYSKIIEYFK